MRPTVRLLLALAAALAIPALAAPSAATGYIEGIDVSNHQDRIRWDRVPDEIRFAFVKASEGTTFVDVWYEQNRALAKQNGKAVGAYHFARPEGQALAAVRRDARAEARFFHAVAKPRSDDLRPVLDLEVTGGLPPSLLKRWTRTFLKRLERLVGVKALIYASPYFWRTAMDDSRWFARNGYRAIWIAHWGTSAPEVPAGDWDGHGWTFWQYTSCGRVAGIEGCVDRNRYRYPSLERFRIGGGADEPSPGEPPVRGGDGPSCRGQEATIVGSDDGQRVEGTDDRDVIVGTSGDDVIDAHGGDDIVCARGGDDDIRGSDGKDLIRGNAGNDTIRGNQGDDELHGQAGDDAIHGGKARDGLKGGGGEDLLKGNGNRDSMRGGGGADRLRGAAGSDLVFGGAGEDDLKGHNGDDALRGNKEDDELRGGNGDDELRGGAGEDLCRTGAGSDSRLGCEV